MIVVLTANQILRKFKLKSIYQENLQNQNRLSGSSSLGQAFEGLNEHSHLMSDVDQSEGLCSLWSHTFN